MPTHDIIDSRTRELAPEINNFLADSIRAHFAVGYSFLSSFQAIAEHIPHLDQLRLLIGNVTNRQTIEQLAEEYHDTSCMGSQRRRLGWWGAFESRMTRKKAKGTKGVARVSWLSLLFVVSCFRVPRRQGTLPAANLA